MVYFSFVYEYRQRSEEGIGSPRVGLTDGSESPCGCWEANPGLLQEQQVLLTSEPSLQPPKSMFLYSHLNIMGFLTHVHSHVVLHTVSCTIIISILNLYLRVCVSVLERATGHAQMLWSASLLLQ